MERRSESESQMYGGSEFHILSSGCNMRKGSDLLEHIRHIAFSVLLFVWIRISRSSVSLFDWIN